MKNRSSIDFLIAKWRIIQFMKDQKQWNTFLLSQPTQAGIFLQSWEWLEFQKSMGRKIWRISGENFVCGLVKNNLPLGKSYIYSPKGPVGKSDSNLIEYIKKISKNEKAIFWKMEPLNELKNIKLSNSVQPKKTIILNLLNTEESLLKGMHEKTRYNIHLSEKKGIEVREGKFEDFWKMMEQTTERDQFSSHPKEYYKAMIEGLLEGQMKVKLFIAYSKEEPVVGAIIAYFGDTATYLHGASSYAYRALMGPYKLQWDIIMSAKKEGYKYYDFWGIDEKKWPGVTRFKKGFGGDVVEYPGTFDLPLSRFWYFVYRISKRIF